MPETKFDVDVAEQLSDRSFEELKPYIPDLLEWLGDGNWPVALPVSQVLRKFVPLISKEMMDVLSGDDDQLIYWCLTLLVAPEKDVISAEIINRLKEFAQNPTEVEKREELDEIAGEILEELQM